MNMNQAFDAALRKELTALVDSAPRQSRVRVRRRLAAVAGLVIVSGTSGVAFASLRQPVQTVTMPVAAPMLFEGTGDSTVRLQQGPRRARYLRVELACFDSHTCAVAGESQTGSGHGLSIARAALPLSAWNDGADMQRLPIVDPQAGFKVSADPGASWRLYAVYTDRLNPQSAQLPDHPQHGPVMRVGIPNNNDWPGEQYVPVMASNGKLGWIDYNVLMGAVPDTSTEPLPVFDVNAEEVVGYLNLP